MLMRDFTEGVILQDYAKAESLESGKLLSKKTPGKVVNFVTIFCIVFIFMILVELQRPIP